MPATASKRITSKDVAAQAGVSRTTVSFVLNGRDAAIPEETRERVRAAAHDLGYVPSAAARALRKGASDFVLILSEGGAGADLSDYMWESFARGFQERGLTTLFSRTAGTTTPLRDLLEEVRPRAIVSLMPLATEDMALTSRLSIPLLAPGSPHDPTIFSDLQERMGQVQGQYLLDSGRRRLIYVSDARVSERHPILSLRTTAFVSTVARQPGAELVARAACSPREPGSLEALTDDLARRIGPSGPRFDAVAAFNDDVAAVVLHALASLGVGVPEQVAVIGVDNLTLGRYLSPALTTLAINKSDAWSEHVVATVMALIDAEPAPDPPAEVFGVHVVRRSSA